MLRKEKFIGVNITNETETHILEHIKELLEKTSRKFYIVTPNPEMIVLANKDTSFRNILNTAEIALPDGKGITLFSKLFGIHFKERITGTDFMETLCGKSADWAVTVGLLGAQAGVAEETANCLLSKYPGLNIVFVSSEWREEGFDFSTWQRGKTLINTQKDAEQNFSLIQRIAQRDSAKRDGKHKNVEDVRVGKQIDILFVAFGHPKQEKWIAEHLEKLPVRMMMGVGGAFDYISGTVPRAPKIIRRLGFEWLYRLIRQPWRVKRILYIAIFKYVLSLFKEKLKKQNTSHDGR